MKTKRKRKKERERENCSGCSYLKLLWNVWNFTTLILIYISVPVRGEWHKKTKIGLRKRLGLVFIPRDIRWKHDKWFHSFQVVPCFLLPFSHCAPTPILSYLYWYLKFFWGEGHNFFFLYIIKNRVIIQ